MENQKPDEESTKQAEELNTTKRTDMSKKLDVTGWGLFFIWVGIALFINLDLGVGLLGVGIIILGGQAARKYFGLKLEGFWIVVGFLFLIGGLYEIFEAKLPLVPILLILAGLLLLVSTFWGRRRVKK